MTTLCPRIPIGGEKDAFPWLKVARTVHGDTIFLITRMNKRPCDDWPIFFRSREGGAWKCDVFHTCRHHYRFEEIRPAQVADLTDVLPAEADPTEPAHKWHIRFLASAARGLRAAGLPLSSAAAVADATAGGDAEAAMAAPADPTRAPSPPPTVASDPLDLDAEDAAGPQADAEDRPPAGEGGLKRKRKKASGAQRAKKKAGKKAEEEDGGFTDKGRVAFKAEGGVLVTGGKRTCLPDALHMLLLSLSIPVDVEEVRTIMPADPNENTRFMAADNFVSQFGLTLQRVTSRFMSAKGGVALALLQASGYFVVQLRITAGKNDKDPDLHCVAYDGATVRDNYQWSKVKDLDEGDRASPASARKVFNSLFHRDLEVRIKNVYELMPL